MRNGFYCFIAIVVLHLCYQSQAGCQNLERFLIFGEFLNNRTVNLPADRTQCKWDSIGDWLRMNMGTVKIHVSPYFDSTRTKNWLKNANAHNGMQFLTVDNYPEWENSSFNVNLKAGRRWLYHPEYPVHYSRTGCIGTLDFDKYGKT
jgi:hypothetical protein